MLGYKLKVRVEDIEETKLSTTLRYLEDDSDDEEEAKFKGDTYNHFKKSVYNPTYGGNDYKSVDQKNSKTTPNNMRATPRSKANHLPSSGSQFC